MGTGGCGDGSVIRGTSCYVATKGITCYVWFLVGVSRGSAHLFLLRFFVWIVALQVMAVAFTSDGNRCLVGGDDKKAVIYDTSSGKALTTIEREGEVRFVELGKGMKCGMKSAKGLLFDGVITITGVP